MRRTAVQGGCALHSFDLLCLTALQHQLWLDAGAMCLPLQGVPAELACLLL